MIAPTDLRPAEVLVRRQLEGAWLRWQDAASRGDFEAEDAERAEVQRWSVRLQEVRGDAA